MAWQATSSPGAVLGDEDEVDLLEAEECRMNDAEFVALLDRARAGDDAATARLLGAFEADVRLMVRVRLPKALRSRFDTMDFVQAVWQSVFSGGRSAWRRSPARGTSAPT